MTTMPCNKCPARLNLEKRLAITKHTLAVSGTYEAVKTLEQEQLLAEIAGPALCEAAADWQI